MLDPAGRVGGHRSSPSVNVIREVKEESGYEVEVVKLAAVYDRNLHGHPPYPFHAYKMFFIARLTGGAAAHSGETDGVGFFGEEGDSTPVVDAGDAGADSADVLSITGSRT